jgi:DNA-binding CsgD family transcriptional regulator
MPGDPDWEPALDVLHRRAGLSRRTAEIGLCYRAGLNQKETAARICCTTASVSEHTRRIYAVGRQYGIGNQASFAAYVEWVIITASHN